MNRYCRGVIVEGVETPEEWRDVQNFARIRRTRLVSFTPGTDRNAEYGGSGAISCLIFRRLDYLLGLAQEEYEEANDEQGRQNNRCDFRVFLCC